MIKLLYNQMNANNSNGSKFKDESLRNKNASLSVLINNVCFLTSKLSENKETEYILLEDFKNNRYIYEDPNDLSKSNDKIEKGINFKIITKGKAKKEIYIKCFVNYDKIY